MTAHRDGIAFKTIANIGLTLICGSVCHQAGVFMTKLLEFIKTLIPRLEPQRVLDEAYLAKSVDIHDLERRMRELEQRGRDATQGLACSLGAR
jgi:hypothetical protein